MQITICEKWTMEVEPTGEPWFAHWLAQSPKQAGVHLTAGWHALNDVARVYPAEEIGSIAEYFGGIGAQALMAHYLFDPARHDVMDISQEAVEHMRSQLPATIRVAQGDAYNPRNVRDADLQILDFGDLTVWKTQQGDPRRGLLDTVFFLEPKAVLVTDIAARYLHLHRERYETLLGEGTCGSYSDYLEGLSERIEDLYGYRLLSGYSHLWSTVMAFVPTGIAVGDGIRPTPRSPRGLEIG